MSADNNDNKRKDLFQAPEGYFDKLPDRILDRIDREEKANSAGKIFSLPGRIGWAAAAVISILAIFMMTTREPADPSSDELIASLSDEEIIDYLVSTDLSLEDIMEVASFDEAALDSLQQESMPLLELSPDEMDDLIDLYDLEDLENS